MPVPEAEYAVKTCSKKEQTDFDTIDDEELQAMIEEQIAKLDVSLVSATQMRKTGPHLLRTSLKKTIKTELKHLALVKVEAEDSASQRDTLQASLRDIHHGTEDSNHLVEQEKGLVTVEAEEKKSDLDTLPPSLPDHLNDTEGPNRLMELRKASRSLLQQTQDLRQSVQQSSKFKKSEVCQAMYDTPPSTPEKTGTAFSQLWPEIIKNM